MSSGYAVMHLADLRQYLDSVQVFAERRPASLACPLSSLCASRSLSSHSRYTSSPVGKKNIGLRAKKNNDKKSQTHTTLLVLLYKYVLTVNISISKGLPNSLRDACITNRQLLKDFQLIWYACNYWTLKVLYCSFTHFQLIIYLSC